jgi:hypothetical protein
VTIIKINLFAEGFTDRYAAFATGLNKLRAAGVPEHSTKNLINAFLIQNAIPEEPEADPKRKPSKGRQRFAIKTLQGNIGDITPTIFDSKNAAHDWLNAGYNTFPDRYEGRTWSTLYQVVEIAEVAK